MPDLVKVIPLQRQLSSALVGATVIGVSDIDESYLDGMNPTTLSGWTSQLPVIKHVERRGKLMLIGFSLGAWLVNLRYRGWIHFQGHKLAGMVQGVPWPDEKDQRLTLDTDRGPVAFSDSFKEKAGSVKWYDSWDSLITTGPQRKYGVEILSPLFTQEWLRSKFKTTISNVAYAMIDPAFFAGMDNWLRNEILWAASMSPYQRCNTMAEKDVDRVHAAAVETVRQEVEQPGRGGMRVWENKGGCARCGTQIRKDTIGGWPVYWCPACQK